MAAPLILASASPRRRELLDNAGIPYVVDVPNVEELCGLPGKEAVAELSRRKALTAAGAHPGCFVLAADTLVFVGDEVMGKPRDPEDAKRMLRLLSGREHQVYTGVTVLSPEGRARTETDISNVFFDELSEEMISAYVESGEPMDKAGAYGIQGRASLFVRRLEGCYSGVMGLPIYLVRRLLEESGYPLWAGR